MTNPFRAVARGYKALRHGRGFGVHSPWAYHVIMNVLRQDAAYYNYDAACSALPGVKRATVCAVFRLLVHLRPSQVRVFGSSGWGTVATLSGSFSADGRPVAIVDDDTTPAEAILKAIEPAGAAIIINCPKSRRRALTEALMASSRGYLLDTCSSLLILNTRSDLPHQHMRARISL